MSIRPTIRELVIGIVASLVATMIWALIGSLSQSMKLIEPLKSSWARALHDHGLPVTILGTVMGFFVLWVFLSNGIRHYREYRLTRQYMPHLAWKHWPAPVGALLGLSTGLWILYITLC
ncbi:Uncharacterised protein [Mycobacteroides abscessus subsp. abscessus]|uniref:hypothetical protein n=1 Tax=Mycobacteroides abscessus TaxID=36809 RepID=UPI00092C29E8|nr:hypothetical protein [Mycobacteroides abscessus]SIK10371.1 Uncharacterised protein [Mycobacteroides abscessus subsp. abscessus]SKF14743.1 Uncharacterised protein [Mycobacteroides abscessus subsp. abscessus]